MENNGSTILAQVCVDCSPGTDQIKTSHTATSCIELTSISVTNLNTLGYPARDLRVLGFGIQSLLDGEYTRKEVIEAASQAGVVQIIVTGASAEGSQAAYQLASEWPQRLFATAGVHPHRASQYDDEADSLIRDLAGRDGVVAIGETGLDYFRDFSPRKEQRSSFEQQIQIAIETGLPFFLHQRDAHDDFITIL